MRAASSSDTKVTDATYFEAGDKIIAQFTSKGTNDGTFGPFRRRDIYYDQLGPMLNLGLVVLAPQKSASAQLGRCLIPSLADSDPPY